MAISPDVQRVLDEIRDEASDEAYEEYKKLKGKQDHKARNDALNGLSDRNREAIRSLEKKNRIWFSPEDIRAFPSTENSFHTYKQKARRIGRISQRLDFVDRYSNEMNPKPTPDPVEADVVEDLSSATPDDSQSVVDEIEEFREVEEEKPRARRLPPAQRNKVQLQKLRDTINSIPGIENYSGDLASELIDSQGWDISNRATTAKINFQIQKYSGDDMRSLMGFISEHGTPSDIETMSKRMVETGRFGPAVLERILNNSSLAVLTQDNPSPENIGRLEVDRMRQGGLISEKPPMLTAEQIAYRENELGGTSIRKDAGVPSNNPDIRAFNARVDDAYRSLPPSWHNDFTDVPTSILYDRGDDQDRFLVSEESRKEGRLTRADAWRSKLKLEYAHQGAAAQPGYQYMMNWLSNANPGPLYENRASSSGMTVAEMENAQRMHSAGEGLVWTKDDLELIESRMRDAGMDVSNRTGALALPVSQEELIYDPHRQGLLAGDSNVHNRDALFLGRGGYGLASGSYPDSPYGRDQFLRAAWERSLPDFDFESQRGADGRLLTEPNSSQLDRARNLDQDTLAKFRAAVVDELKRIGKGDFSNMPTASQILDRASKSLGRGMFGIAPMALFLADPELAQKYDELTILKGEELYHEMGKTFGLGEAMTAVNQTVEDAYETGKSGAYGPHMAIQSALGEFGWNTVKAAATEVPGIIQSMSETPKAPESNISWAERQRQQQQLQNVVPLYQESTPWKKYGGVLQREW